MDPHPFDDTATDALLDGKVSPAQAPDGLQHVAALIHLAQAPATVDRAAERQVVSQMGAMLRGGGSGVAATRFAAHRARLATVAAVAGFVVLGGGAVAAAAGALPNPVQRVVASGFSDVGISMPTPTTGARPVTTTTDAPPTTTRHRAASLAGLCVAFRAASKNPTAAAHQARATAFVRLAEAAKAHDESVATYCTHVLAARKPVHPVTPPTSGRPPTSTPGKGKGKPEDPSGTHHPSPPPPAKGHGSDGHHGSDGPTTIPSSPDDGGGHTSGSDGGSSGHTSGSDGGSSGPSGHH